jgi:hypothetical protein
MPTSQIEWPVKTREINDAYFESARWNGFPFRDGDVVVATYAKVGTTWMQQIVWQLIHGGPPGVDGLAGAPWLDMRIIPFQSIMELYARPTGAASRPICRWTPSSSAQGPSTSSSAAMRATWSGAPTTTSKATQTRS